MGRDVVYSLLPRQSINLNKPLRIFKHSPTAAARSLQARTSEGLKSERLFPSALKFPSQLNGGGGRGESSSFTAEWFPHCKREVVSSPPSLLSSLPTPPPSQTSVGNGCDVCCMENCAARLLRP